MCYLAALVDSKTSQRDRWMIIIFLISVPCIVFILIGMFGVDSLQQLQMQTQDAPSWSMTMKSIFDDNDFFGTSDNNHKPVNEKDESTMDINTTDINL